MFSIFVYVTVPCVWRPHVQRCTASNLETDPSLVVKNNICIMHMHRHIEAFVYVERCLRKKILYRALLIEKRSSTCCLV